PFLGDHAGGQPAPETEEMRHCGMKIHTTMRLRAVQVQGHRENGELGDDKNEQCDAEPAGMPQAMAQKIEKKVDHRVRGLFGWRSRRSHGKHCRIDAGGDFSLGEPRRRRHPLVIGICGPSQCVASSGKVFRMPIASPLLLLEQVSRRLAGRDVVKDVTFSVARGEVLGLLGVNGAGKSTTLAMIAGVLAPDAGVVKLDGLDLHEHSATARTRIGYLPENVPLWPELTVREYLDACGRLRGLDRAARNRAIDRELLRLDLSGMANRLSGQLSLGQKRRLGLAQALLHDPELLVLDEPGNGLDPVQTAQLRELIRTLS